MLPLTLKVVDTDDFHQHIVVGQTSIDSLHPFFCDPWTTHYVPPKIPGIALSPYSSLGLNKKPVM